MTPPQIPVRVTPLIVVAVVQKENPRKWLVYTMYHGNARGRLERRLT
jgi:hypothetical protein